MTVKEMERILQLCIAITGERDREKLLSQILNTAMDIACCDAGTLYLLEEDGLHFCRMITRSLGISQGGHDDPITLPPVPLEESFVCSWAAIHNRSIRIADVHTNPQFDFTGSLEYDAMTGYQTTSMLVVPLTSDKGVVIGVMQLINALDASGKIIPFDPDVELLVTAIASQAAISITNRLYSDQISDLLDSLVRALSEAIDERSPYTANHTRNMVVIAARFIDWLNQTNNEFRFDAEKQRSFLMSVWLHDIGKLAIPTEVMDKATRLGDALADVEERLRVIGLLDQIASLSGKITEADYAAHTTEREDALQKIRQINLAGFLSDEDRAYIKELAAKTYVDENGTSQPWLTEQEVNCLLITKGTLTSEERSTMESHVSITKKILNNVTFPKIYNQVPQWASSHHEFLNGMGYPQHISQDEIPMETRLLTILDVFEALTAQDRPYKKGMPPEKALTILDSMAQEGQLDAKILSLFKASNAWNDENHTQETIV